MSNLSPRDEELFRHAAAPPPYQMAVDQLGIDTGKTREQFEQLTPSQIYQIARETYAGELPEFWRVWGDWHDSDEVQPMGDL
jgi:hypothetical protein